MSNTTPTKSTVSRVVSAAALSAALIAAPFAVAQDGLGFGLGRTATDEEVAAWDIDIRPDGLGLPVGSGSVLEGEDAYFTYCAACHGDFGEGVDRWPIIAGGFGTLDGEDPVKTVGSYWPYLSTVYDYVRRAMPYGAARTLTDDEVYALTAYILFLNDIVTDEEFVLSDQTFTDIEMPNVGGFEIQALDDELIGALDAPCMTDCVAEQVRITMRARVLDVTPDDGTDDAAEMAEEEAAADAIDAELVAAGEALFQRNCASCHMVGDGAQNRAGPVLTAVFGATPGQVEGFRRYSRGIASLADTGAVWTSDVLDAFLADPRGTIQGTSMAFRGLSDADDRAAIIEYLRAAAQ